MHISHSLENLLPATGLTIGNFDGVHLGHQYLIKTLRKEIGKEEKLAVLTFNNHPADVLPGRAQTPLLCNPAYKRKLLERAGVDLVIAIDFTKECAEIPYDVFLNKLKKNLCFSHLMLGKGASFGKNRMGNETHVSELAKILGFQVHYLEKQEIDHKMISSGQIRTALEQGDFLTVKLLLGKPYALFGELKDGLLATKGLCLPPSGIYPITIRTEEGQEFSGKAHVDASVKIECEPNLLTCTIEAIFL